MGRASQWTPSDALERPYPWFGGKAMIAAEVWRRLGNTKRYIDPCYGGGAVHLTRPREYWDHPSAIEVINDADAFVANFWRAVQSDPSGVAAGVDWPINEHDLESRHRWLREQAHATGLSRRVAEDPQYYDTRIAAWWCWGQAQWIGSGWCKMSADGQVKPCRQIPKLTGRLGVHRRTVNLAEWIERLSSRLRHTIVCGGDWSRVCGKSLYGGGDSAAVFFDPPYGHDADRDTDLYSVEGATVAADIRRWCLEHGSGPHLRIALCGYAGEHEELEGFGWTVLSWKACGGYANQGDGRGRANAARERIWFSPACIAARDKTGLFDSEFAETE